MGFAELSEDGQHAYDSALIVNSQGQVITSYRKIHLFQHENHWFLPGEQFSVVDFGLGPVGVLICYDLEFPEAVRELALRGAQWIAVCTGNMTPNQHLQETFLQARAAENRIWIAVSNRTGEEGNLTFFGGSAVANPHGNLSAQASDQETLLFADLDLSCANQARLNADYLADRKPRLYQATVKS
jgi:predicted amidohydrolase